MAFPVALSIHTPAIGSAAGVAAASLPLPAAATPADGDGVSFGRAMYDAIARVDAQGQAASGQMAAVDGGDSDDLVGAMLASQEASLSFSMLLQVRNKLVGAVDDLIKMPV